MIKTIALVLVVSLISLGIGFGFSSIIYQPQIQNLQSQINSQLSWNQDIQSQLNTINSENGKSSGADMLAGNATMHLANHVYWNRDENGTDGNFITNHFNLIGKFARIQWYMVGTTLDSRVTFYLNTADSKTTGFRGSSGFSGSFDSLLNINGVSSEFYLKIEALGGGDTGTVGISRGVGVVAYQVWIYDYY
jgi:hypothetical protein